MEYLNRMLYPDKHRRLKRFDNEVPDKYKRVPLSLEIAQ